MQTRSIVRSLRLPGTEYFPGSQQKSGIAIHHTVGGSAQTTFQLWRTDKVGSGATPAHQGARGNTNSPLGSRCRIATTFPPSTVNEITTSGNSFTRNWCGRQG